MGGTEGGSFAASDKSADKRALRGSVEAACAMGQLLANLYRSPMDQSQVAFFRELPLDDPDDLFMGNEHCRSGVAKIQRFFNETDLETARQSASDDFHKLFVGPDKLRAAPWSSCYVDAQGLFGPTALRVEKEFRKNGLSIPEGVREPSDHIAYEIQFIVEMQKRALENWPSADGEPEDTTQAAAALEVAKTFKAELMDIWVDQLLAKMSDSSRNPVYDGVADLTRGYLEIQDELLNAIGAFEEVE